MNSTIPSRLLLKAFLFLTLISYVFTRDAGKETDTEELSKPESGPNKGSEEGGEENADIEAAKKFCVTSYKVEPDSLTAKSVGLQAQDTIIAGVARANNLVPVYVLTFFLKPGASEIIRSAPENIAVFLKRTIDGIVENPPTSGMMYSLTKGELARMVQNNNSNGDEKDKEKGEGEEGGEEEGGEGEGEEKGGDAAAPAGLKASSKK